MRKKIIAGNWKMNCVLSEGQKLASEIIHTVQDKIQNNAEIVLIPPFVLLSIIHRLIGSTKNIFLGAQNCHQNKEGAFTGEVSATMLASCGVSYVILGHSERRKYFYETDDSLAKKIKIALINNLTPIFCCGEELKARQTNDHESIVAMQIENALFGLSEGELKNVVIAYEPVWAIGTGKTATPEQAQEMHTFIRNKIAEKYSQALAESISILYGGSVKPKNAKEIFSQPNVDGGLIGNASLIPKDFMTIIKSLD